MMRIGDHRREIIDVRAAEIRFCQIVRGGGGVSHKPRTARRDGDRAFDRQNQRAARHRPSEIPVPRPENVFRADAVGGQRRRKRAPLRRRRPAVHDNAHRLRPVVGDRGEKRLEIVAFGL